MKKKVIAIIPARAGSKRLKDKNILKFYKKPLVTWAIESALKSCMIDTVLVTSNSKRVEKICSKFKKVIFNDHYLFNKNDFIKYADYNIVMTEKDAIKCQKFAMNNFWVLPLETKVDERLFRNILKKVT